MKGNVKIYISIITIIAVIGISIYGINEYIQSKNGYIIFPDNSIYYKNNNKITKYEKALKTTSVKVITDSSISNLKAKSNGGDIQFYKNKSKAEMNGNLMIAYSSKLKMDLGDFKEESLDATELEEVNQILKEHGIIGYETLLSNKVTYDFDKDGINETIYFISNLFEETQYDKTFSFAYYINNGNINYLLEQVDSIDNVYNLCIPYMNSIIDINGDKKYELVMGCRYFNDIGTSINIYQKNSSFELLN